MLVRVADTFAALHALTRAVRDRVPERLVAVTGSAGKTTTKDLLAAMLARRFRVAQSPGNLNNLYGFPVALLGIPEDTEWMVAEMGMSEPGELARISRLGRPDVAVFTNVRPVHLEFFADLGAIAAAKEELLAGLAPDGLVVANADDPQVTAIAHRFLARARRERAGRVVWYGHARGAPTTPAVRLDVAAAAVEPAPAGEVGSRFVLVRRRTSGRQAGRPAAPRRLQRRQLPGRRRHAPGRWGCRWRRSPPPSAAPRRPRTAASSTRCPAAAG